ncbi:DUF86 domain-containing protein [Candidatus Uhrbacteria bacterium]|nr:DUF86 domain-containing protein [Candidatus Uhrbacteria bacterium]
MVEHTTEKLKTYFEKRDDVLLAFLFGSRGTGLTRPSSDWDIAVYLTPRQWGELETKHEYQGESDIRADVERLVSADVDLAVLNRARPSLVFSILNSGLPLALKDMRLYLTLLSRTHYDAVDYWNFVQEYRTLYERAQSLAPEARALLLEHLTFLENELEDAEKFSHITYKEYQEKRDTRRNIERWIENCVMSALDIAKVILASEKRDVPQTYKDMLREFGALLVSEEFGEAFSEYASLRNILAHEYMDLRWERIEGFARNATPLYSKFTSAVKTYLSDQHNAPGGMVE